MINQIWRYSHFALAVSSSVFVLLAAITGGILAFEPIDKNLQPYKVPHSEGQTLAKLVDSLTHRYDEVLELAVDPNGFVSVSVISMDADLDGDFYINPFTGEKIGDIPTKRTFFEFFTNLHRSLFLKTTGRILVGIGSFLLSLIAITGFLLFIKRQRGIRYIFKKLVKEGFAQHYHVALGRWMLIPVFIVALTGVYLSLLRFSVIEDKAPTLIMKAETLDQETQLPFSAFKIFQQTPLRSIKKLEFPFSPEVEDPFILTTKKAQFKINQLNGQIIEELQNPFINGLSSLSFDLHTGTGSIIWSAILLLSAISILFFMYSGTLISLKRLRSRVKNSIGPQAAEIVILVGSENGSTRQFAKLLQKVLLKHDKQVFLDDLNAYQQYSNMKELVIMTSTYGIGDPPANADQFLSLFERIPLQQHINCHIVGFGSFAYPDFCQFALDIDEKLRQCESCHLQDEPYLIHNQSYPSFVKWAQKWGEGMGIHLALPPTLTTQKLPTSNFEILEKQCNQDGFAETFLLTLRSPSKKFTSGDLLAITPPEDPVERLYSIAKTEASEILLSIKRHEKGLCSNYLSELEPRQQLQAYIQKNKVFHLPQKSPSITFIANGTGIAPFLGMLHQKHRSSEKFMYWGGRNSRSYQLYESRIIQAINNEKLKEVKIAYSRENSPYTYVQDIIKAEEAQILDRLKHGGTIMICGAIAMQNDVLEILEKGCRSTLEKPLSHYQNKGQIMMDCY